MTPTTSRSFHSLIALALCGALLPAAQAQTEAPACHYTKVATLPLHYTGMSLALTTEGSINGSPATMLVDTGASDSALTTTGTERRKLAISGTGRYTRGVGGSATVYQARVDELSAGPARSGRTWMRVLGDFGSQPQFDAIIGAPFLLQTDMELSLATKELRFFRPSNCGDRFLAYWDPAAIEIPFEASRARSPNPHFTVLVNGQKMEAMIDSGASATLIRMKAAQRAGLKLDAPGVTRLTDIVGIGADRVAHWSTTFDTFQIGEETVKNAEVGVIDSDIGIDVLLGADFLRAHRVLFAMSQKKLYLSYVGGEPFGQRRRLEPWIQQEAEAGNSDAQMVLSQMVNMGHGVAQDRALGASWLEKAARGGNPQANIATGHELLRKGFPEDGAARLRSALDKLPSNRTAALWLYLARVRSKQPDLAKTELAANFARNEDNAWPGPIADFYLGKITEEALLKQAGADAAQAKGRTCQSVFAMTEWYQAHGNQERVEALIPQRKAACPAPPASAGVPAPSPARG
jgi:clan AA aspartic protease (TIGR02281 family)